MPELDWPATRRAIDTAVEPARREIEATVETGLGDRGRVGEAVAAAILAQVQDSLDDIDQTVPPAEPGPYDGPEGRARLTGNLGTAKPETTPHPRCQWWTSFDEEGEEFARECGARSRFRVERSDRDPSYEPAESCPGHLPDVIPNMLEGCGLPAIVTVHWDGDDE